MHGSGRPHYGHIHPFRCRRYLIPRQDSTMQVVDLVLLAQAFCMRTPVGYSFGVGLFSTILGCSRIARSPLHWERVAANEISGDFTTTCSTTQNRYSSPRAHTIVGRRTSTGTPDSVVTIFLSSSIRIAGSGR